MRLGGEKNLIPHDDGNPGLLRDDTSSSACLSDNSRGSRLVPFKLSDSNRAFRQFLVYLADN